jgi:hypothetical protein
MASGAVPKRNFQGAVLDLGFQETVLECSLVNIVLVFFRRLFVRILFLTFSGPLFLGTICECSFKDGCSG